MHLRTPRRQSPNLSYNDCRETCTGVQTVDKELDTLPKAGTAGVVGHVGVESTCSASGYFEPESVVTMLNVDVG